MKYAAPRLKLALLVRYNSQRQDYIQHAQELVAWAQEIDEEAQKPKKSGKFFANAVGENGHKRACYACGNEGHIKKDCPRQGHRRNFKGNDRRGRGGNRMSQQRFALATSDGNCGASGNFDDILDSDENLWIIDSGASRHLVSDEKLLEDVRECTDADALTLPDGGRLQVTKVGKVTLQGRANVHTNTTITLSKVVFAPKLAKNLISLGCLRKKGCMLKDNGEIMELVLKNKVLFPIEVCGSVFVARLYAHKETDLSKKFSNMVMNVASQEEADDVQEGTLHHFMQG